MTPTNPDATTPSAQSSNRRFNTDWIAGGIIVAVCCLATYLFGKDANWDALNYHFYSPHALLNIELAEDFMGASTQRYLNPLAYLPFYWMVRADMHSLTIGLTLTAIHAMSLVAIWYISMHHVFAGQANRVLLSSLATGLAFLSPVYLGSLGATFVDPTTSVLILFAVAIHCRLLKNPIAGYMPQLFAGLLCGAAIGLKLTNLIFGVAFFVAAVLSVGPLRTAVFSGLWFGFGGVIGVAASYTMWGLALDKEFGNPVFPLLNQYFKSPDFPDFVLQHARFLPQSWGDILSLPFRMVEHRSWVYIENLAPDLRLAALALLAAVLLLATISRRHLKQSIAVLMHDRALLFLLLFFTISYFLWVKSSGNGRYAIPLLVPAGPLLVLALVKLMPNRSFAIGAAVVLVSAQTFVLLEAGNPRWTSSPWTARWFELEVPAQLKRQPYGYLLIGTNTHSFVAPFLHPASRFSSVVSAYSINPTGPGGNRVRQFINTHQSHLRFMTKVGEARYGTVPSRAVVSSIDTQLAGWDVHVDQSDCAFIRFAKSEADNDVYMSCALLTGNAQKDELDAERTAMAVVFDSIERACPSLFSPGGVYLVKLNGMWLRRYLNTDITAFSRLGRVFFSRYEYGPFDIDIGSVDEWKSGNQRWACTSLPRG